MNEKSKDLMREQGIFTNVVGTVLNNKLFKALADHDIAQDVCGLYLEEFNDEISEVKLDLDTIMLEEETCGSKNEFEHIIAIFESKGVSHANTLKFCSIVAMMLGENYDELRIVREN